MANPPSKYYSPRRALPGQPLPTQQQKAVDERSFHLLKAGADTFSGALSGCTGGTITGPLTLTVTDTNNAAATRVITYEHAISGNASPASGCGTEEYFQFTNSVGTKVTAGRRQCLISNPAAGLETTLYAVTTMYNGTEIEVFRVRPVGMLPTAGAGITGFTGGQFWMHGDLFHSGTSAGFYNVAPITQPAGSSDVLASLVNLGLRAASSNPPLDLGTGTVTCGKFIAAGVAGNTTGVFTAPSGQVCLNLIGDTGDTIFVTPKSSTLFSQFTVSGSYQWGTDPSQTNTNLFHIKNTVTGNDVFTSDNTDKVVLGANNAFATGVLLGGASSKIGFYGLGTPIAKPTLAGVKAGGTALANLITLLVNLGLLIDTTT